MQRWLCRQFKNLWNWHFPLAAPSQIRLSPWMSFTPQVPWGQCLIDGVVYGHYYELTKAESILDYICISLLTVRCHTCVKIIFVLGENKMSQLGNSWFLSIQSKISWASISITRFSLWRIGHIITDRPCIGVSEKDQFRHRLSTQQKETDEKKDIIKYTHPL